MNYGDDRYGGYEQHSRGCGIERDNDSEDDDDCGGDAVM